MSYDINIVHYITLLNNYFFYWHNFLYVTFQGEHKKKLKRVSINSRLMYTVLWRSCAWEFHGFIPFIYTECTL
jgi:hypothetical protein